MSLNRYSQPQVQTYSQNVERSVKLRYNSSANSFDMGSVHFLSIGLHLSADSVKSNPESDFSITGDNKTKLLKFVSLLANENKFLDKKCS